MSKSGDWLNVSYGLLNNEIAEQPIVVFPPDLAWPLSHYYSGKNAIVPIPRELDPDNYDPREFALGEVRDVQKLLTSIDRGFGFWLVTNPSTETFVSGGLNEPVLEEVVANFFDVRIMLEFNGTLVRLIRAKKSKP